MGVSRQAWIDKLSLGKVGLLVLERSVATKARVNSARAQLIVQPTTMSSLKLDKVDTWRICSPGASHEMTNRLLAGMADGDGDHLSAVNAMIYFLVYVLWMGHGDMGHFIRRQAALMFRGPDNNDAN